MDNRTFLLCLLVSCLTVSDIECRFRISSPKATSRLSWSSRSKPSSYSIPSLSNFGSSHSYPRSGSGLSGTGYSSAGSRLSGTNTNSHGYPSSGSGLSGSKSNSHGYPSSGSRLSGSKSNSHGYPSSGFGLSGSKSGVSRSSSGSYIRPQQYGTSSYYSTSYHTAPQYVYVHNYRHSDSRYGDLLTGLSLYNLGRSYSHYHNHYYYDDYYRHRYESSTSSYGHQHTNKPSDEAKCFLRIRENGKLEVLKIPCEIVSTFTEANKKVNVTSATQVNQTVCTTNSTNINNTVPVNGSAVNSTVTTNATMVNVTVCTTNSTVLDPLTVKGPPADVNNMECVVEIRTNNAMFRNNVDCKTLFKYAKIPEPEQGRWAMLPSRDKLKSWLKSPPWWLTIFIAV